MPEPRDHHTLLMDAAHDQPHSVSELRARVNEHAVPLPADPWARWLLVAYARHVPRQRWVARVVEENLGGSVARLATDGGLGHPLRPQGEERVPGLEDWRYFFHGIGCCLTHTDGTSIDVNFDETGGDSIDQYFYSSYLASLRDPEPIEAGLIAPRALAPWWTADLATLEEAGLIRGRYRAVLMSAGIELAQALEPILLEMLQSESPLRRAWLAVVLGEWRRADAELQPLGPAPEVRDRALRALNARISRLSAGCQDGDRECLQALAQLGQEHAEAEVVARLDRALDGSTSVALDILDLWDDPRFIDPLPLRKAYAAPLARFDAAKAREET